MKYGKKEFNLFDKHNIDISLYFDCILFGQVKVTSSTARNVLLTEEEVETIFNSANNCAETECSVEDVSSLIAELKDQKTQMEERLKMVEKMVYKLEHLNDAEDREVDAVRQTVRDFLRVFNTDVSDG